MDLRLYARVAWRFKWLVATGFVCACGLAFLSLYKIDSKAPHGYTYRSLETWTAQDRLLVSQQGFPWGSSQSLNQIGTQPGSYSTLAVTYVNLAMSNPVLAMVRKRWKPYDVKHDSYLASPVLVQPWNGNSPPLPFIDIIATSTTAGRAKQLADVASSSFIDYIRQLQGRSSIPADDRVSVTVVRSVDVPTLVKGHSKTLPIVVFLTVMMGFFGLSLVLENLRPRTKPITLEEAPAPSVRRSA